MGLTIAPSKMGPVCFFLLLLTLTTGASAMSHAQAMARLVPAGITVTSSGSCSDRLNPTCTCLSDIRENSIAGIVALKSSSGCLINVTGGTETGHTSETYSHWNGYKLDISRHPCINNYVVNSMTYVGIRPDGAPIYQDSRGNIYAAEGNHWDILCY